MSRSPSPHTPWELSNERLQAQEQMPRQLAREINELRESLFNAMWSDIPEFEGHSNPDDFLDWLNKIERCFELKAYSDERKCRRVVMKFKGYTSLWWDNYNQKREREGKERIKSWEQLKWLMKRKFISENTVEDHNRLHALKQHEKSIEDICICALEEEKQQKFMNASSIKVDTYIECFASLKKEVTTQETTKENVVEASKTIFIKMGQEEELEESMGDIKESLQKKEDEFDEHIEEIEVEADDGEILVLKEVVETQICPNEDRMENLFQTRCSINKNVSSAIVDIGSCKNVASTTLLRDLQFPNHTHPNKLQWIANGIANHVAKQVLFSFSIEKDYVEVLFCDIISMDACHLLFWRPWKLYGEIHIWRKNVYFFKWREKKIIISKWKSSHCQLGYFNWENLNKEVLPFDVLKRFGEYSFEINLPNEFGTTSTSFFMKDISSSLTDYNLQDLRANPLQLGENDADTSPESSAHKNGPNTTWKPKNDPMKAQERPTHLISSNTTLGLNLITWKYN